MLLINAGAVARGASTDRLKPLLPETIKSLCSLNRPLIIPTKVTFRMQRCKWLMKRTVLTKCKRIKCCNYNPNPEQTLTQRSIRPIIRQGGITADLCVYWRTTKLAQIGKSKCPWGPPPKTFNSLNSLSRKKPLSHPNYLKHRYHLGLVLRNI